MKIPRTYDGAILFEDACKTMRATLENAAMAKVDLTFADLRDENLAGINLCHTHLANVAFSGAYLACANFAGANLTGANFSRASLMYTLWSGANLRCASLYAAFCADADLRNTSLGSVNFRRARLSGAKLNWQSRTLLSELLRRAAGPDVEKLKIAGLVLMQTNWCWGTFCRLDDPLRGWALAELAKWVMPDDDHPGWLDAPVGGSPAPA